MPILAAAELFFQVFFAIHAIRTGRDRYWIFIIIFFPGAGCLIYFFAEYLPYIQQDGRMRTFKTQVSHSLNPGKQLRLLKEQVELTPSIKNKKLLAEAYVNQGLFDEAISLFESCQDGAHKNDLSMLEGLSCAHFFKGDYQSAEAYLEMVLAHEETIKPAPFQLLLARCREARGRDESAEQLYRQVIKTFSGEEARCRYAMFLKKKGRLSEADALFDETLNNARLSPRYYRRTQKPWIETARKERSHRR